MAMQGTDSLSNGQRSGLKPILYAVMGIAYLASSSDAFVSPRICCDSRSSGSSISTVASITKDSSTSQSRLVVTAMNLRYSNSDGESYSLTSRLMEITAIDRYSWWKPKTVGNSMQDSVDDYLEFLERRYRHLHSEDNENEVAVKFSAWKWLTEGATMDGTDESNEDALHILGLESLASDKLLHKHGFSSHHPLTDKAIIEEIPSTITSTTLRPKIVEAIIVPSTPSTSSPGKVSTLVKRIQFQRKQVLLFQDALIRQLKSFISKIVKAGPGKTVSKLMGLGVGAKTLLSSVTIISVFILYFISALTQAAISRVVTSRS